MAPAVGRVHRALLPAPTPAPVLEYADQKDQFATTNSTLWRQQRYAPRDNHTYGTRAPASAPSATCARRCCARRPAAPSRCPASRITRPSCARPRGRRGGGAPCRRWRRQCATRFRTASPNRSGAAATRRPPTSCSARRSTGRRGSTTSTHTGAALVDALLPHPHPNGTHASNYTVDLGSGSDLLLLDAAPRRRARADPRRRLRAEPRRLVDVRLFDAAGASRSYNTYGRAAGRDLSRAPASSRTARTARAMGVAPRAQLRQGRRALQRPAAAPRTPRRPSASRKWPQQHAGEKSRRAQRRPPGLRRRAPRLVTNRSERHEELLADAFAEAEPVVDAVDVGGGGGGARSRARALRTGRSGSAAAASRRAAPPPSPRTCNSIHPLWIPEMGAYLGVAPPLEGRH